MCLNFKGINSFHLEQPRYPVTSIQSPFPPSVSFVALSEARGFSLHPQEEALLSPSASEERVRQFTLGRAAARAALAGLGIVDPPPVLRKSKREPLWPEHLWGSITHAEGLAAAGVVAKDAARGIGIDLESRRRTFRRDPSSNYCSTEELRWVNGDTTRSLLIFSAKETIYKALFPRYQAFFGFQAVDLEPLESAERFVATLGIEIDAQFPRGSRFRVGWKLTEDYVFTWTLLEDA